jgi:hypothetical protein
LAFFNARHPSGLRVFTPLREPLILSATLLLGNYFVQHVLAVSSIYRLGAILGVEGIVCALFLVRMVMSWHGASELVMGEPNPA